MTAAETEKDLEAIEQLKRGQQLILDEMRKVIVGQEEVIEQILISLFSRGHCLVVGVPGLAKTLIVKTLASILDLDFKRIQFTPDLMPSDITGTDILEEDSATRRRSFKFIKGPVFANMLLADEINRTPPKTQAALLEAMQEYRVTASGNTYTLDLPFFVLATQNPIEQEGTYPLPEAQLDRFMFNTLIDYPERHEEITIIKTTTLDLENKLEVAMDREGILNIQRIVRNVPVSEHVVAYAADLVRGSRPQDPEAPQFIKDWVSWGAGPRAAQYLILGAKARAIMDGRVNVSSDDVRSVAFPVMRHRIFTNFNADSEGVGPEDIVQRLLDVVEEQDERIYRKVKQA